jgi:hypothetical protein
MYEHHNLLDQIHIVKHKQPNYLLKKALTCTTSCNDCFAIQETNEAELEDAYMLSRIVSL